MTKNKDKHQAKKTSTEALDTHLSLEAKGQASLLGKEIYNKVKLAELSFASDEDLRPKPIELAPNPEQLIDLNAQDNLALIPQKIEIQPRPKSQAVAKTIPVELKKDKPENPLAAAYAQLPAYVKIDNEGLVRSITRLNPDATREEKLAWKQVNEAVLSHKFNLEIPGSKPESKLENHPKPADKNKQRD